MPVVPSSKDTLHGPDPHTLELESWRAWLRTLAGEDTAESPLTSVYTAWRSQIDDATRSGRAVPSRFRAVEAATEFMMLGEQLLHTLSSDRQAAGKPGPTIDPLREAIEQAGIGVGGRRSEHDLWGEMLSAIPEELRAALHRMASVMQRQSISGMPAAAGTLLAGELLKALGNGTDLGTDSWNSDAGQLLDRWAAFQSTQARYLTLLERSAGRALSRLSERIIERGAVGQPVETVRAAYDLWIECSEESYAELLASDEFANAHAAAINALVALKGGCSRLSNHIVTLLDAPSRSDHTTLERRLHEARRRQRHDREQLNELLGLYHAVDKRLRQLEAHDAESGAPAADESKRR